jgi:hypothetical protein
VPNHAAGGKIVKPGQFANLALQVKAVVTSLHVEVLVMGPPLHAADWHSIGTASADACCMRQGCRLKLCCWQLLLQVVFNKDSSRVGPKEWVQIAKILDKNR